MQSINCYFTIFLVILEGSLSGTMPFISETAEETDGEIGAETAAETVVGEFDIVVEMFCIIHK